MWLVTKHHDGLEPDREQIPAAIHAALVRWYIGEGTTTDEKIGVMLVHRAKMFERWLACDCIGTNRAPPLLSPAYLTEAETYYLRRLTGGGRPEHKTDCPFFRDQSAYQANPKKREAKPLTPVDGFFAALKPLGEHLAQKPIDDSGDNRVRGPSTPRLARLLWSLIDRAETNIIDAVGHRERPGIAVEYRRLGAAAKGLCIAPSVPLDEHLYRHPDDLRSQRIYAQLRKSASSWPDGHEPQAFLLLFAPAVTRREVLVPTGDPIFVASDIVKPAAKHVDRGPYLVLVAIGEHAQARGYAAVRAYAQPIQDGRHFTPVDSNAERKLLTLLMKLQWDLSPAGVSFRIKKPVFDLETELGPCRPDFMLDVLHRTTGQRRLMNVELLGYDTSDYERAKTITIPRMALVAPVTDVRLKDLDDEGALRATLAEAIMTPPA